MSVHIYAPTYCAARSVHHCNTCKRRRRIVVLYYTWHEPLAYCTACGEMPNDSARRFKKVTFARERKIAKARSLYESATSIDEVMRRLTEDLA
jgi:hypothetical protein